MPARVIKSKGKFRVVDTEGKTIKNSAGLSRDNGGHMTGTAAEKQAKAINYSKG